MTDFFLVQYLIPPYLVHFIKKGEYQVKRGSPLIYADTYVQTKMGGVNAKLSLPTMWTKALKAHSYAGFIYIIGNGSKNQFADDQIDELKNDIAKSVMMYNTVYGKGKWAVLYGGDPPDEEKRDIGWVASVFATVHSVPVYAIQCRACAKAMLRGDEPTNDKGDKPVYSDTYAFLAGHMLYETERSDTGKILYAGTTGFRTEENPDTEPVGTTAIIYQLRSYLIAVHAYGGGVATLQEVMFFRDEAKKMLDFDKFVATFKVHVNSYKSKHITDVDAMIATVPYLKQLDAPMNREREAQKTHLKLNGVLSCVHKLEMDNGYQF